MNERHLTLDCRLLISANVNLERVYEVKYMTNAITSCWERTLIPIKHLSIYKKSSLCKKHALHQPSHGCFIDVNTKMCLATHIEICIE